jgi:hypothetical protein
VEGKIDEYGARLTGLEATVAEVNATVLVEGVMEKQEQALEISMEA